jgi:hypothetical protein
LRTKKINYITNYVLSLSFEISYRAALPTSLLKLSQKKNLNEAGGRVKPSLIRLVQPFTGTFRRHLVLLLSKG